MIRRINSLLDIGYRKIVAFVSHDFFFYGVIALCVAQALWYVFSYVPWINDEFRHYGNIIIYSQHLSPFLGQQKPAWDYLGEITRDGSFMFYYLMSWPLRLVRVFTHDTMAQVISLRLVCILIFTGGLVLLKKAFAEIGTIPKSIVHLIMLFFVTVPAFAILPATVNYDDAVFLLFSAVLLLTIRVVKSRNTNILYLITISWLGLLMCLVKWTSIGLFLPFVIYLAYDQYKKYGLRATAKLLQSLKKTKKNHAIFALATLAVMICLFIARPVANVIQYHTPSPSCPMVIGTERCKKFPDYIAYATLKAQKPAAFKPADPIKYLVKYWAPKMIDTADNLLERGTTTELPAIIELYSFLTLVGALVILICLRDLLKLRLHRMLLFIAAVYLFFLLLDEYGDYLSYGVPAAIRARYLLPVLPIFIYFVAYACIVLWGRYKKTLLSTVFILLLCCMQGGGVITYIMTAPTNAYWHNSESQVLNDKARELLTHIVLRT